jgi:hypothetical protein
MPAVVPSGDNLFRGAHHPVAFQKAVFRRAKFMKLYWDPKKPSLIEASFVWDKYAPTQALVHAYGCRVSAARNNRRPDRRDVYCGAYHLKAAQVCRLAATPGLEEIATAEVVHQVENNEIAHVASLIRLHHAADEEGIEGVKTAIVDRLWNGCSGPLKHTCDPDGDLDPHPSNSLELAPLGLYVENRTRLQRAWSLVRYCILVFIWKLRSSTAMISRSA